MGTVNMSYEYLLNQTLSNIYRYEETLDEMLEEIKKETESRD